ncbi:MAG: potassium channel family protein [Deltaproteobacteria bacterium]|nr:potassium channel family protein [Deltaproteobacteria bacterium]
MRTVRRRLKIFLALFLVVMTAGTVGFMVLEDLSFSEAFYYNIVTMSTVGYGDIHPTKQASRIFAILLIVVGVGTFLGVIANITEMILLRRETQSRMRKVNILLGIFFSEVGCKLLSLFSGYDQAIDEIREDLLVRPDWTEDRFSVAQKIVKKHNLRIDMRLIDMETLLAFLNIKRGFLVSLLENSVLIEQEEFSEALLALFHLTDELSCRDGMNNLPESDRNHLAGDMNRAYKKLVEQWLVYMSHLKNQYPYLFSLAVRKNPFDPEASPIVLQ